MTHEQWGQEVRSGRLRVVVDEFNARQMMECGWLPRRYRFAHFAWVWASWLRLPAAAAVALFWNVWVGLALGGLAFLVPTDRLISRRAGQVVLKQVLRDKRFYESIAERGILL